MIAIIKRFLNQIIIIISLSAIHLVLQIVYWPTHIFWHITGVILVIINLMILMHIFIRTARLVTIKKQFTAIKNKVLFGVIVILGIFINAIIMYTFFIVLFQLLNRLIS